MRLGEFRLGGDLLVIARRRLFMAAERGEREPEAVVRLRRSRLLIERSADQPRGVLEPSLLVANETEEMKRREMLGAVARTNS